MTLRRATIATFAIAAAFVLVALCLGTATVASRHGAPLTATTSGDGVAPILHGSDGTVLSTLPSSPSRHDTRARRSNKPGQ